MIYTKNKAIEALIDIMQEYGVGRLLLVHGKNSYRVCGGEAFMKELCELHPMEIKHFTGFSANPKIEEVYVGVKGIEDCWPQAILAIGGGSAMDVAKLMRYEAQKTYIPLITIPTTSGTGAEATQFSVCYVDGKKESYDKPELLPNYTVLIPELTMGNNRYLTVCTGFDAFAQAIESYWNIHSTPESEQYAEKAINMLFDALIQFAEDADACMRDYEWRSKMMQGANLAGKAINITRTTAPHAMSYTITSKFGYPHGHAVALTFPYFAKLNIECPHALYRGGDYERYAEKMRWLRTKLGMENRNIEESMRSFIQELGIWYNPLQPIDTEIVAQSVNVARAGNNPHDLSDTIFLEAAMHIQAY